MGFNSNLKIVTLRDFKLKPKFLKSELQTSNRGDETTVKLLYIQSVLLFSQDISSHAIKITSDKGFVVRQKKKLCFGFGI